MGIHRPVILPIGLMNIGSGPLRYAIDLDSLARSHPELIKTKSIAFQNESSNIGPLKKVNFVIEFRPVSLKRISFPLHIDVFDYFKQIQKITLQITAAPTATLDLTSLNAFFKVDVDLAAIDGLMKDADQGCYLSDDLLDFRTSKLLSKNERVILLTNLSLTDAVQFWFDGLELTKQKRIDVYPSKGILPPKTTVQLIFVYEQNDVPVFWEGELSMAFRVMSSFEDVPGNLPMSARALEMGSDDNLTSARKMGFNGCNLDGANKVKVQRMFLRVKISTDLSVSSLDVDTTMDASSSRSW